MIPDDPGADPGRTGVRPGAELRLARLHRVAEPLEQIAHRRPGDPPAGDQVEDEPERSEGRLVRPLERQPGGLDRLDSQAQRAAEVGEEARPRAPVDLELVVHPAGVVLVGQSLGDQPHRPAQVPEVPERDVQLHAAGGVRKEILGVVVRHRERAADDALDSDAGGAHRAVPSRKSPAGPRLWTASPPMQEASPLALKCRVC